MTKGGAGWGGNLGADTTGGGRESAWQPNPHATPDPQALLGRLLLGSRLGLAKSHQSKGSGAHGCGAATLRQHRDPEACTPWTGAGRGLHNREGGHGQPCCAFCICGSDWMPCPTPESSTGLGLPTRWLHSHKVGAPSCPQPLTPVAGLATAPDGLPIPKWVKGGPKPPGPVSGPPRAYSHRI